MQVEDRVFGRGNRLGCRLEDVGDDRLQVLLLFQGLGRPLDLADIFRDLRDRRAPALFDLGKQLGMLFERLVCRVGIAVGIVEIGLQRQCRGGQSGKDEVDRIDKTADSRADEGKRAPQAARAGKRLRQLPGLLRHNREWRLPGGQSGCDIVYLILQVPDIARAAAHRPADLPRCVVRRRSHLVEVVVDRVGGLLDRDVRVFHRALQGGDVGANRKDQSGIFGRGHCSNPFPI
nr:hypothetical protein [Sinorhizobium medicae]